MKPFVREHLSALPPLRAGGTTPNPPCKMCAGPVRYFDSVDFQKFCDGQPLRFGRSGLMVDYLRCEVCDFIFTSFFDDWSQDDFATYIYNDDYKVDPEYLSIRPERTAVDMATRLAGAEASRILDYGSGTGAFARAMGALGFAAVVGYDPFSSPERPSGRFDLITCFEVIEHSPDPHATITDMLDHLADGGCIIVGQTLQPGDIAELRGAWWYLAPRNGHVSTFSSRTLSSYAARHGLGYHEGMHIFGLTRGAVSALSATVLGRIAFPRHRLEVFAPPDDGTDHYGWHAVEHGPNGHFRWTALPEVMLGVAALQVGINVVCLPYVLAIDAGFPRSCRLEAAGCVGEGIVTAGALAFQLTCPRAVVAPLVLRTAPVRSPREIDGTPDDRALGLAVACGGAEG